MEDPEEKNIEEVSATGIDTPRGLVTPTNQVLSLIRQGPPHPGQRVQQQVAKFPVDDSESWTPGSFGFGGNSHRLAVEKKLETLPIMVLRGITTQQEMLQLEMKSELSGAASAAGIVGFGNIINSVLKYLSAYLIQYGFGPAIYGLYTLVLSIVNLISSVFNLGLDDAMVRYVAIYRSKQRSASLRGLIIFCTTMAGIAGIIGALLLLVFAPLLVTIITARHGSITNKNTLARVISLLQLMAPLIPLLSMQVIWVGGLRGFKAFKLRVLAGNIFQPALLILLILGVLVFFRNITGIAIALLISAIFGTVLNLYFLFRQVSRVSPPEPGQYELREWMGFASFNFLTTIIDTILDSIDTLLLASFGILGAPLGQYAAAIRFNAFISLPLLSLNNIFAPTIAELHSKGERTKLEVMFKVVTKWSISFSFPIFLITVLFAPYLLVLSGPAYEAGWPLLIAFSLGGMLNAGTGSVGYMLLMTGHQKLSFLNSITAVIVNVFLGIILTPRYGAMGTAISTGLAICILNLMRLSQVRILLKMQPYRLDSLKPILAGIISSAPIAVILYLSDAGRKEVMIGHAVLSEQLLLIPVFLAMYIGLLVLFKFSPEDQVVLNAVKKKLLRNKSSRRR